MLVEAAANTLTNDVRAVLEVLAGQVAIAVEDCRLANANVQLERRLAEGERLAALGQMAATVAHEVKNPLSAIKSIAQVMSEDEGLKTQHARDLSLIVGETDRLSNSVTQLLSFASKAPPASVPCRAGELLRSVAGLFRVDAEERHIALQSSAVGDADLDGVQTAALRDAGNGFFFVVNPAGARADGQISNNAEQLSFEWDGIWLCSRPGTSTI